MRKSPELNKKKKIEIIDGKQSDHIVKRVRGVFKLRRFSILLFPRVSCLFLFYIPIMPDMPLLAYAMGLMSG
jgi:hypothetical protein